MKKSHLISFLTGILIIVAVALQFSGRVFAQRDDENNPNAVTLTPSQIPSDTPVPPTDTPVPDTPVPPTNTALPDTPAPTATNTPETPTNTPEPTSTGTLDPTSTSTNTPDPTNTPEPTNTGTLEPTNTPTPTQTTAAGTAIPTYRPRPGGRGNLGIIGFWAFAGGFSAVLLIWLARIASARPGESASSGQTRVAVKDFVPAVFLRRWFILVLALMLLGTVLGYVLVNFT